MQAEYLKSLAMKKLALDAILQLEWFYDTLDGVAMTWKPAEPWRCSPPRQEQEEQPAKVAVLYIYPLQLFGGIERRSRATS